MTAEPSRRVLHGSAGPPRARALAALGWKLLDLPAQLRISTIDSFCRDLALQQPLLSGLGGGLDIDEQPTTLPPRRPPDTLNKSAAAIAHSAQPSKRCSCGATTTGRSSKTCSSKCSAKRDRWMHDFVLEREPDWDALRERLERPFANAVARGARPSSSELLDQVPGARDEAIGLARFACEQTGGKLHRESG